MPPRLYRVFAVLLLAAFAWLALAGSKRVGVTFDEPAHLAAGRAYWEVGDYRLHAENGLLPQRWAALPAALADNPFPNASGAAWESGDVWGVARAYLFGIGNDVTRLLFSARSMIVVFALALLVLVWRWAASLWGERGGLLALALAAFCPHLLAHGALATSDMAAALGFVAALLAWWRLLHRVSPARVFAAGVATAFLALAKFSGVLLAPVVALLLAARMIAGGDLPASISTTARVRGGRRALWLGGGAIGAVALAWLGVWAGYGFRYAAGVDESESRFAQPWSELLIEKPTAGGSTMADGTRDEVVELRAGMVQHFVRWAREHRMLPEAYLYGLAFTDRFSRHRLAYFSGEFRERGWREFFPAAFALKTTLPALALLAGGTLALARLRRPRRVLYRLTPVLAFTVVYAGFALTTGLNIGHRHLLPLYPLLYVFAGAALLAARNRFAIATVVALATWHGVETVRVRPHFLTYFNQLAGGPVGGHRFFVDSSLDWGQGLPDLSAWLAQHRGDERVYLSYFGSDDPVARGIDATRVGDIYFDHAPKRVVLPALQPGVYCISATMLHRVYTQVRGPWSAAYEAEYGRLVNWFADAARAGAEERRDADGQPLDESGWIRELTRLEQLRFGRLCRYLERRQPDSLVANSVFIYRLTEQEIQFALSGPLVSSATP